MVLILSSLNNHPPTYAISIPRFYVMALRVTGGPTLRDTDHTENPNDIRYKEDIVKLLLKSRGTNDRIVKTADITISSIAI
jgi:hypothetical protein